MRVEIIPQTADRFAPSLRLGPRIGCMCNESRLLVDDEDTGPRGLGFVSSRIPLPAPSRNSYNGFYWYEAFYDLACGGIMLDSLQPACALLFAAWCRPCRLNRLVYDGRPAARLCLVPAFSPNPLTQLPVLLSESARRSSSEMASPPKLPSGSWSRSSAVRTRRKGSWTEDLGLKVWGSGFGLQVSQGA